MPAKRKFKSAAVQELYDEVVGSDPSARDDFEQELVNIEVAQLIHDMRTGAGLSQRALAKKVRPRRRSIASNPTITRGIPSRWCAVSPPR